MLSPKASTEDKAPETANVQRQPFGSVVPKITTPSHPNQGRGSIAPHAAFQFIDYSKSKEAGVRKQINGFVQRRVRRDRLTRLSRTKDWSSQLALRATDGTESHARQPLPSVRSTDRSICPSNFDTGTTVILRHDAESASKEGGKKFKHIGKMRTPQQPSKALQARRLEVHERVEKKDEPSSYLRPPMQVPKFIGNATDPFRTLPGDCTDTEYMLVHNHLEAIPELLYGIRRNASFNPNRDIIFPTAQMHPAIFQWILVTVASFLQKVHGQSNTEYILRRRSTALRLTNQSMNDPKMLSSDNLLLCICAAVLVESRYGDAHTIRSHLNGLKALLKRRGGIACMVGKWWHTCVVQAFHLAGSRGLDIDSTVPDVEEHRGHTEWLVAMLKDMQQVEISRSNWQAQHRGDERIPSIESSKPRVLPYASVSLPPLAKTLSVFDEYAGCRVVSFSRGSPLHTILSECHKVYQSSPSTSQQCFLAVLLSLNIALWEYHNDPAAATYYLRTLTMSLKRISRFDDNGTMANIETINWLLVNGGLDIAGEDGSWVQAEFLRKFQVVNAMTVLARVEYTTREEVKEALYSFLIDEKEEVRRFRADTTFAARTASEHGANSGAKRRHVVNIHLLEKIKKEALRGLSL